LGIKKKRVVVEKAVNPWDRYRAGKKGKSEHDRTRTADITDVNPQNRDHARDVTLLEVESFNN